MLKSRPYENNLKLLLVRRMANNGLSFEKAMVAYDWFDHYYSQYETSRDKNPGQKAFEETRSRVMGPGGLDEKPPMPHASLSIFGEIKRQLKNWPL